MALPPGDLAYLQHAAIAHRTFDDGTGWQNVELLAFPLPPGLNVAHANVLFRLAPSYPDTPPDMWWVIPHLASTTRGEIPATQVLETHDGRTWQRWSRHLDPGSWRSGIDGMESYIRLLRTELDAAAA